MQRHGMNVSFGGNGREGKYTGTGTEGGEGRKCSSRGGRGWGFSRRCWRRVDLRLPHLRLGGAGVRVSDFGQICAGITGLTGLTGLGCSWTLCCVMLYPCVAPLIGCRVCVCIYMCTHTVCYTASYQRELCCGALPIEQPSNKHHQILWALAHVAVNQQTPSHSVGSCPYSNAPLV